MCLVELEGLRSRRRIRQNDFVGLYTGGPLVLTDGLYDSNREKLEQKATGYGMPAEQFIRLPYVGLLLKPLTLLRYDMA